MYRRDKILTFADGKTMSYDELLIATGARPYAPEQMLPAFEWDGIRFYNSRGDVEHILSSLSKSKTGKVIIVGAGIRSLELADALTARNPKVSLTIVNRSARLFGESGDSATDELILSRLKSRGVEFLAPVMPQSICKRDEGGYQVDLENGPSLSADLIVFGMGTQPNSELAKLAGLELYDDSSIKVDSFLKTSDPHIYAAGDVVSFENPIGSGIVRNSKWRSAKKQGQIAAVNMAGTAVPYHHEAAVHITSFFGLKAVFSGNIRSLPEKTSLIDADNNHYYRYILVNDRLKSFSLVWDAHQQKPKLLLIRKALLEQTPLHASDLLTTKPARIRHVTQRS